MSLYYWTDEDDMKFPSNLTYDEYILSEIGPVG